MTYPCGENYVVDPLAWGQSQSKSPKTGLCHPPVLDLRVDPDFEQQDLNGDMGLRGARLQCHSA